MILLKLVINQMKLVLVVIITIDAVLVKVAMKPVIIIVSVIITVLTNYLHPLLLLQHHQNIQRCTSTVQVVGFRRVSSDEVSITRVHRRDQVNNRYRLRPVKMKTIQRMATINMTIICRLSATTTGIIYPVVSIIFIINQIMDII